MRSRLLSFVPSVGLQRLVTKQPFRTREQRAESSEQRADTSDLAPGKESAHDVDSLGIPRYPRPVHLERLTPSQEEGFLKEYDQSLLVLEGLPATLRDQPVLVPNPLYSEAEQLDEDPEAGCEHAAMLTAQTTTVKAR